MKVFSRYIFLLLFISACTSQRQTTQQQGTQVIANLKSHIEYLADDRLEGRRAGTEGERIAREYIAGQFKAAGFDPGAPTITCRLLISMMAKRSEEIPGLVLMEPHW
jgi:aminopeptidase YwaD